MGTVLERNHVVVTGHGPPLIFAHGFGCDQTVWDRLAPAFEADHTVVRFDYVGAGKSDAAAYTTERYRTADGYVLDLLEVCHALGLRRPTLVGHSVSGMVGALATIAEPDLFDRLVMLAPSPRFVDDPPYRGGFQLADIEGLLQLLDANFLGWSAAVSRMALPGTELAGELEQGFSAIDPSILREFARVAFLSDHRGALPRVPVPCLVVQCSRDDLVPVDVGEYVVDRLPHGRWCLLDIPGHMPHMTHPDEVRTAIRSFLSEPDPR
ncbi:MAG: alpha/beta hydrolase [Myxococcota bacterium]